MEQWTLPRYLLVTSVIVTWLHATACQQAPKDKEDILSKNEKIVVFPTSNESDHNLPVFPDPVVKYVGRRRPLAPRVDKFGHPFCRKKTDDTFCENVEDYPETDIRKAINYSSEEFKELFGTLTIHARKIVPSDMSEETVCSQQARLFYPKAAVNENDQWAYVINDVDYVQAVMAEICENEDKPCTYLDGALPAGVSSRCRQKYAYKRLLALHPNQKKTYTDAFRFPSCCVCYIKRPYILSRTRLIRVDDKISPESTNTTSARRRGPVTKR
ncbi:protein spaetzle-like [Uloborus diversus]|uniref:protein spaetzle-like n=1 Tax=Uloborus diversus TaxID=327109 RepID=UPI00240A15A9|nr:protein spaetzle-like [Uloborus diversus]